MEKNNKRKTTSGNEVDKVIVLVQMNNGNVHEVLASERKKIMALNLLNTEKGNLRVKTEVIPVDWEFERGEGELN